MLCIYNFIKTESKKHSFNDRHFKLPGRLPEVNFRNRACARELCRSRLVEDPISPNLTSYRKREYFDLVLPWQTIQIKLPYFQLAHICRECSLEIID